MKLIITTILLFALGFFGTGLAIHPESPLAYQKLMSNLDKEETNEENGTDETEEPDSKENEDLEAATTIPEKQISLPDQEKDNNNIIEVTDRETIANGITTAVTISRPIVTKRPVDTNNPIVLSSQFKQLTRHDIKDFLADKKPNIVIVADLSSSASIDLIDSLNVLSEAFPMMLSNTYVINTSSTELTINRGAVIIDANFSVSTSPAIYYQRAALIHYHKSLKNIDYSDLHTFAARIYE